MRLDMSGWEHREFDVTNDLRLDPKNVRLGLGLKTDPPQGDLIQELFTHEDALDLARSIVDIGWLTHEQPVVLDVGGRWTVIEGNRRIAALKALQNPRLVPPFQSQLETLLARLGSDPLPQRIECLIAPSRSDVDRLVATLHTARPRKPWRPLRQALFFAGQVDLGKTVASLIDDYPGINVKEFIETAEMHRLLASVPYENDDLVSYVQRGNFPISTFDRLASNPVFRELARIEVEETTGHVTLAGKKDSFDRLAEKIVGDMKSKRIDTRRLNRMDSKTYLEYMQELQPFAVPAISKKSVVATMPPAPKPTPKPKFLSGTAELVPVAGFPSIERLTQEISTLPYGTYPNATLDLIRTFLEKSIKAYAHASGQEIKPKRAGSFVFLDDALVWLAEDLDLNGGHQKRALKQVIQKLRSKEKVVTYTSFSASKTLLDATNHNHQMFAEPSDALDAWESMLPLLKYVLRQPKATA
jgi:ParB-like chromosome segregation protein Spo0J